MRHTYVARIYYVHSNNEFTIKDESLPAVLKEVRRYIKIDHGNKIRTALIEQGAYRTSTYNSKKRKNEFCSCCIRVERYQ